jgi:hypothetical protein
MRAVLCLAAALATAQAFVPAIPMTRARVAGKGDQYCMPSHITMPMASHAVRKLVAGLLAGGRRSTVRMMTPEQFLDMTTNLVAITKENDVSRRKLAIVGRGVGYQTLGPQRTSGFSRRARRFLRCS